MPAITVDGLRELCQKQIDAGNGKKQILISDDEEGNGFHPLIYNFTPDVATQIDGIPVDKDVKAHPEKYIILG